jgi:hypothetical protein
MFDLFLKALVGAIVWTLANVVYFDLKRRGVHGFTRFAAFWVGNPTTWITFFVVSEGRQPTFEAVPDDEDELLAEIRHDRSLRAGDPDEGAHEDDEGRGAADAPPPG